MTESHLVKRLRESTRDIVTGEPLYDMARPDLFVSTIRIAADTVETMAKALRQIRDYQPKGYRAAAIARKALADADMFIERAPEPKQEALEL